MTTQAPDTALIERLTRETGCAVRVIGPFASISNAAWHIALDDREAVLRTHTLDFGAPVTDHGRERALHTFAARHALAPSILWSDIERGVLVTELEPAGTFSAASAASATALQRIAVSLRHLHALAPPSAPTRCTLAEAARTYVRRADRVGEVELEALVDLVCWVERDALATDDVVCHRDLLHANVIASDPVRFIDWEFASVGERWFDVASFCVWQELSAAQREAILAHYLGRTPSAAEVERVVRNEYAFRALCTLWSLPEASA